MKLKGSKTEQNLKDAFAGESQANRRYLYFAAKADVEGYNDVAAVFRSTAEGETGHAHGHLEYLEAVGDPATGLPIGETGNNLKAAIAGETHEYTRHVSRAWPRPRAARASRRSRTGSRRSRRPSARTRTASRRRSTRSASSRALSSTLRRLCPGPEGPGRARVEQHAVTRHASTAPRRQPRGADAPPHRLALAAVHRRERARQRARARLRHLPRLPPLLQPLQLVPDAVRCRRRDGERRAARRAEAGVLASRRALLPLRHVLHDEVPVRAAARMERRLPALDAAREGQGVRGRQGVVARQGLELDGRRRLARRHSRRRRSRQRRQRARSSAASCSRRRSASTAKRRCRNITRKSARSRLKDRIGRARRARSPAGDTHGRVAVFATCYGNRNHPGLVEDLVAVLEHNEHRRGACSAASAAAACRSSSSAI